LNARQAPLTAAAALSAAVTRSTAEPARRAQVARRERWGAVAVEFGDDRGDHVLGGTDEMDDRFETATAVAAEIFS
jgi:hypothetical protein